MTKPQKYLVVNFGCQMNVLDSERMEGILLARDMQPAQTIEDADLFLINSCMVREKPERKALSLLGKLCKTKQSKPGMIIGFCGCVAQHYGELLLERFPGLDFVLGTNQVARLGEVLEQVSHGKRFANTDWIDESELDCLFMVPESRPVRSVRAFVTIMEGCDNYCAYCVVPNVRGPERSRRPSEIIAEIENLAAQGVKEIVLLGQNVNSYGLKSGLGIDFADLLLMAARVEGVERLRFTTSHPKDLSDKLISVMAGEDKVCEQIHLPLQAGSDRVLQAMGRGYSSEEYLKLVHRLRSAMPELGLSTDLITGFPGESEDDFLRTLEMVKEIGFDEAFTFRYSDRPGTRAALYPDQVPEAVRLERLWRLDQLVAKITEKRNSAQVGKLKEILLEGESKRDAQKLTGRTRDGRLVHITKQGAEHRVGELAMVRITRALKHSLLGELLKQEPIGSWQGAEPCLLR